MPTLNKVEFAEQLRQALQNLHDVAALQKLPLTSALSGVQQTLDQSVRQLRAEIMATIEQLNPPLALPHRAKERRPYVILYGRYVQGMSTTELVEELALSVRQLRREHARALTAITNLLWARLESQLTAARPPDEPVAFAAERQESRWAEAEQLISQSPLEIVVLSTLLNNLAETLAPMAASRGIKLECQLAETLPPVRANRVLLRQGVMELISSALRRLSSGQIVLASAPGVEAQVSITAWGETQSNAEAQASFEVGQKLFASLGGRVESAEAPGRWQAIAWLPTAEDWPILVMDDNAGLIELFRRYLAGRSYRVIEALTAAQVIALAQQVNLKLIVLDIMLPGQDGWEVLQQLRAVPETRDIPILICSALSEPEIAYALGASDYLTKPVTQDDLLTKVERWCQPLPPPAAPPKEAPANN